VSDDTIDRRAALLTGRNHHAVGMGGIPEASSGFPGYSAMLPKDAAPFPKVLKENGPPAG
jgi:arylsulfatase A-like enzyme